MTRSPRFHLEAILALLAFLICFAIVIGLATKPALSYAHPDAGALLEKPLQPHPSFS